MGRDRLLKGLIRQQFLITLKTGEGFMGLLDEWDESTLQFVNAVAVSDDGQRQKPVDGHLVLFRSNVAYMQRTSP